MRIFSLLVLFMVTTCSTLAPALPGPQWAALREELQGSGKPEDLEHLKALDYISRAGTLKNPNSGQDYWASCCGQGDAYEADDYEVDKDGNLIAILTCNDEFHCKMFGGNRARPPGTKIKIPPERVLRPYNPTNNTGHGWVWINPYNEFVFCWAPPAGL